MAVVVITLKTVIFVTLIGRISVEGRVTGRAQRTERSLELVRNRNIAQK